MIFSDLGLWPDKLAKGFDLAHNFYNSHGHILDKKIKKIAFVGMGGSGIAGRIVKTFLDKQPNITSFVIDSPDIPAIIDAQTLAIVISYSGNTWETLSALNQLVEKSIPTIILAHGGKAQTIATEKKLPFVHIEEALAPRLALGYFLGFLLGLFDYAKLLDGKNLVHSFCKHTERTIPLFSKQSYFDDFINKASKHAFFHIWGVSSDSQSCAYRAQTQFNENSKIHAASSAFPELCHNLMVGFTQVEKSPFVLFFHTNYLSDNLKKAIEATSEILKEKGVTLYKPPILGDTFEEQLFNMILWADYASCYLGQVRKAEVLPVKIIDLLKDRHKQKGIAI